jgi:predicted nuclease of predicted toxin-antitoxin system
VPGRFPLLTDENVPGPLIDALRSAGWDVLHARDIFGEHTDDEVLIEYAARRERVLVSTDQDHLEIAHRWLRAGKPFRMVWWKQAPYQHLRPGAFVEAFDELAARADDPFRYPICYLKPKA